MVNQKAISISIYWNISQLKPTDLHAAVLVVMVVVGGGVVYRMLEALMHSEGITHPQNVIG